MNDSWEAFVAVLREECAALRGLHAAALAMTDALVANRADGVESANAALERARSAYGTVTGRRRGMQRRGFGDLSLRKVASYAPRSLVREFHQRIGELHYYAISLQITNGNNKSLIVAGMERLMQVVALLQKAANEQPGTYRRRGNVPTPDGSVLVSRKA